MTKSLLDRLQGDWVYMLGDQPLEMATRLRIEGAAMVYEGGSVPVVVLNDMAVINYEGGRFWINRGKRWHAEYPAESSFPFSCEMESLPGGDPIPLEDGVLLRLDAAEALLRERGLDWFCDP